MPASRLLLPALCLLLIACEGLDPEGGNLAPPPGGSTEEGGNPDFDLLPAGVYDGDPAENDAPYAIDMDFTITENGVMSGSWQFDIPVIIGGDDTERISRDFSGIEIDDLRVNHSDDDYTITWTFESDGQFIATVTYNDPGTLERPAAQYVDGFESDGPPEADEDTDSTSLPQAVN